MSDKKIIIDLSQTDTKSFDDPIQADAKIKFEKLINDFLIKIDKNQENNRNGIDRVHNTILINGKRGMGKTSFILSVENAKKNNSSERVLAKICSLGIIDPTLIETKEHVFLNIITLIKDKVDDYIRCDKCDQKNSKYKTWKESLRNLSGGLSMLDGVGSNPLKDSMWDSPELVLEKGLSNAKQGYKLELDFHKFIDNSLKILEKDAFFLILDDIDTSLNEGRTILEILRKYLTSRKLIIAMLGDIDLYSTLVRQLQWEKMDTNGTLKKYEEMNKYVAQIEHLEEQYLTKVLKPENRIDLQNLFKLKENLEVIDSTNKTTEPFVYTVHRLIKNIYLTEDSAYVKYYQNILLTQSTRSIFQILLAWKNNQEKNNSEFVSSIRHTFYTTIKKKIEKYNLLDVSSGEEFLNRLFIFMLNENISTTKHFELLPEFGKEDENIAILYINAYANNIIEPKSYLSYFIKICYVLERYNEFKSELSFKKEKFLEEYFLENIDTSSSIVKNLLHSYNEINSNSVKESGFRTFGNIFIKSERLGALRKRAKIDLLLNTFSTKLDKNLNFLSFFALLGSLADISEGYSINSINDERIKIWVNKTNKIKQLPIFVLAKIWTRFATSLSDIEERQNKSRKYHEMFDMYIAGFLNAVYVEIELYENRENKRRNDSTLNKGNVSTNSEEFYLKLRNDIRYILDDGKYILSKEYESEYTLFDYLYECPLLKLDNEYFIALAKDDSDIEIQVEAMDHNEIEKVDFEQLPPEEQKKIIMSINGWESYAIVTIANYLRYWLDIGYKNVSTKTLRQLIREIKSEE